MSLSGKIIEWNGTRGFGYVESEGRRIFLHFRDFAERSKVPEVGDRVTFVLGADRQGRPCAQLAVHIRESRRLRPVYTHHNGGLRLIHFFILVFLLLPGFAIYRLTNVRRRTKVGGNPKPGFIGWSFLAAGPGLFSPNASYATKHPRNPTNSCFG
jgi:cold shock CspA family protein